MFEREITRIILEVLPSDQSVKTNSLSQIKNFIKNGNLNVNNITQEKNNITKEKLDDFLNWITKTNSISFNRQLISLSYSPQDGVGIYATTAKLSKNQELIKIPLDAMISARDPLLLILELIKEKVAGRESKWTHYINVLPTTFTNMPMMWSMDDILLLKGTRAFDMIIKDLALMYKQYSMICQVIREGKVAIDANQFSFQVFEWARAIVLSRQNQLCNKKGETLYCLTPLYDFFNHKQGGEAALYDAETETLSMKSGFDCLQGQQVYMTYGSRSNAQLFVFMGFVDESCLDNESMRISVQFKNQKDPLHAKRIQVLDILGLPSDGQLELQIPLITTTSHFWALIVLHMTEVELDLALQDNRIDMTPAMNPTFSKATSWLKVKIQVTRKVLEKKYTNLVDVMDANNSRTRDREIIKSVWKIEMGFLDVLLNHLEGLPPLLI